MGMWLSFTSHNFTCPIIWILDPFYISLTAVPPFRLHHTLNPFPENSQQTKNKMPIHDDTASRSSSLSDLEVEQIPDIRDGPCSILKRGGTKKSSKKNQVLLETWDEDELGRTKSLTDDDLEDLKGCLDLGFGFSYDEIPELCNTLPALELCYSMSQKYQSQDDQHKASDSISETPLPNWKISSPGDDPEDVKARLKYWAQAVACTVQLCS